MKEPAVQEPARRRGDLVDPAAMLRMVRFLMTRPSCAQVCQEITLDLLSRHQPRSVVLALFGADGALHVVGEFGVAPDAHQLRRCVRPGPWWLPGQRRRDGRARDPSGR